MSDQLHATTPGTNGAPPQPLQQPLPGMRLSYQYAKVYLDYTRQSNVAAEKRLTKLLTIALGGLASSGALLSHVAVQGFPNAEKQFAITAIAILSVSTCFAASFFILVVVKILEAERSITIEQNSMFHPHRWSETPDIESQIKAHTNEHAADAILMENRYMTKAVVKREETYDAAKARLIRGAIWLIVSFFVATMIRCATNLSNEDTISPQSDLRPHPTAIVPNTGGASDGTEDNGAPAATPSNDHTNTTQSAGGSNGVAPQPASTLRTHRRQP